MKKIKESPLRKFFKDKNISLSDLSKKVGGYPQLWNNKILGLMPIRPKELVKISEEFNVDKNELLVEIRKSYSFDITNVSYKPIDPYLLPNYNFSSSSSKSLEEKYVKQRIMMGFDDTELGNLHKNVIKFLIPRVERKIEILRKSKKKYIFLKDCLISLQTLLDKDFWDDEDIYILGLCIFSLKN